MRASRQTTVHNWALCQLILELFLFLTTSLFNVLHHLYPLSSLLVFEMEGRENFFPTKLVCSGLVWSPPPPPSPPGAPWGVSPVCEYVCVCVFVAWPPVCLVAGTAASLPVFLGRVVEEICQRSACFKLSTPAQAHLAFTLPLP